MTELCNFDGCEHTGNTVVVRDPCGVVSHVMGEYCSVHTKTVLGVSS